MRTRVIETENAGRAVLLGVAFAALCLSAPRVAAQGPDVRGVYADLELAGTLIQDGKHGQAEALCAALLEDIPKNPNVWYKLALARQLQGKREEAVPPVRMAIELKPDFMNAHLLAAELLQHSEADAAVEHALKAAELAGTNHTAVRKAARVLLMLRKLESCNKLVERVVEGAPDDPEVYYLAAEVALQAKDTERAAAAYVKLTEVRPKDPFAWESLARLYVAMKRDRDAVKAFVATLEIHPSNIEARKKVIALMTKLRTPRKQIDEQRAYLRYYERWARLKKQGKGKARGHTSRPPR